MDKLLLDTEDEDRVRKHKWWVRTSGTQICAKIGNKFESIGRYVLQYYGPLVVDHINREMWDNRKENLRLVTQQQNLCNRGPRSDAQHSKYKGVTIHMGRWQAKICINGKRYTRLAKSELEAARKYDELAKRYHGEYAYLNNV